MTWSGWGLKNRGWGNQAPDVLWVGEDSLFERGAEAACGPGGCVIWMLREDGEKVQLFGSSDSSDLHEHLVCNVAAYT